MVLTRDGWPLQDLNKYYELGKVLGRGQFGTTRLAKDIKTHKLYACKSIATRKLVAKEDREDVRREVQIMHHLKGHPNITYLVAALEDRTSVHLIMDLCSGGELFDRITKQGYYRYVQCFVCVHLQLAYPHPPNLFTLQFL